MKRLGYGIVAIMLLLLGGCVQEQEDVEVDLNSPSTENLEEVTVTEDSTNQVELPINKEIESYLLTESQINSGNLLKSDYDTGEYLTMGDWYEFYEMTKEGENIPTMEHSFVGYQIIDDINGSEKKALYLFWDFKGSNVEIDKEVTFIHPEGVFIPGRPSAQLFYENTHLKPFDKYDAHYVLEITEEYLNGPLIGLQYNEEISNNTKGDFARPIEGEYIKDCFRDVVPVNEEKVGTCAIAFTYTGAGEYLIGADDGKGGTIDYLLAIE